MKEATRKKLYGDHSEFLKGLGQSQESVINNLRKEIYWGKNNEKEVTFFKDSNEFFKTVKGLLDGRALSSIGLYSSTILKYFKWLEKDDEKLFAFDYEKVLNQAKEESEKNCKELVVSRDEVYECARKSKNPYGGLLMALLFEGIGTISSREGFSILGILKEDFTNEGLRINGLNIKMPDEIEDLIVRLNNGREVDVGSSGKYLFSGISKRKDIIQLRPSFISGYISRGHGVTNEDFIINGEKISEEVLINSAKLFYLAVIESIQGFLEEEDYYCVMKRYGLENPSLDSYYVLKRKYKKYKKKYLYSDSYLNEFYPMYLQFKKIGQDMKKASWAIDQELGIKGEEKFYKYLVEKYGIDNVLDETKNGVGYDFSVRLNKKKEMYEVKSTRAEEKGVIPIHMTINEIDQANRYGEKYHLCILKFNKQGKVIKYYEISNPIKVLTFTKQFHTLLELKHEKCIEPISAKINILETVIKGYSKSAEVRYINM